MTKMSEIIEIAEAASGDLSRARNRAATISKILMPRSASELSRTGTNVSKKLNQHIIGLKKLIEKDNSMIDRIMWTGFSHDFLFSINDLLSKKEQFDLVIDEIKKVER